MNEESNQLSPEASTESDTPRWTVLRRLEFIEFRLFWTGRVQRSDLRAVFGISAPQATNDFATYQERAPGNAVYDSTRKAYVRGERFEPTLIGASIDRYLLQVTALRRGWLRPEDTWFDTVPPVEVVALDRQRTQPAVLAGILDAIREQQQIEVEYSSMTGSPATRRLISPHAMATATERWYVRAYSAEHQDFRDYALGRIAKVKAAGQRAADPANDLEWNYTIDLILEPNPGLNDDRQRAQRLEHSMDDGTLRVPCRLSLAFYLIAEHKLDVPNGALQPVQQPLVLRNLTEVLQEREVARRLSKQALKRAAAG
ncbi:MAG: WYL domain-containing protein [Sphingomonadaceae bacterium]|nr:WYL domain-containing protein [Sphingomonadaceae bacterium]